MRSRPMGIELVSGSYLTGQSLGRNKIPVLVGEDTAYQFEDTKKKLPQSGPLPLEGNR